MAEPSYYPLNPLKPPPEVTTYPLEPLKCDASFLHAPNAAAVENTPIEPLSSKFRPPLRSRFLGYSPSSIRPPAWRAVKTPLEMALLPLVAIAYLAFCYTVHGKAVPVNIYGLYAVTPEHFATIKGGITSISIIVISIALYPIYNIISDLKSEEFFRLLTSHSQGVPLETVNHISNPSFGNVDKLSAMWNHNCSNYYILGIVASLLIWIVSTLAPGALTINSVLADGELMAFAIGAIPLQSVLNGTAIITGSPAFDASLNAATAASIAWAEMELDVQYSFGIVNTSKPDYTAYIAPVPLDVSTATSARWLTDVIGINPTCSWASTNLSAVHLPFNSSSINSYFATAYLPDFNIDVPLTTTSCASSIGTDSFFATVVSPTDYVTNHTTQAPVTDGSTVFLLGQCTSGCLPSSTVDLTIDMSSISTVFGIVFTDQTWSLAILTCVPNIAIETREVRSDTHGLLTVQPRRSGNPLIRQGNLDPIQTTALFSIATSELPQNSGILPNSAYSPLGSQVMGDVLFGKPQIDGLPGVNAPSGTLATITPAPIGDITDGYTQIIRSATKSYLAGYLGTAYVPGRISTSEIVFAASIPNLAVATAVFTLLAALVVIAHFRPGKGTGFTLVNVAAAVHESELPALFARGGVDVEGELEEAEGDVSMLSPRHGADSSVEALRGTIEGSLSERRVFLQKRADGSPVLHIEC